MTCAACGHENRTGRKFCAECGGALALACPACSTPCEAGEKFCGECGAALGGAAAPRPSVHVERTADAGRAALDAGARKVVTIVFADLVGSTALHERLDAESARRVMERYYAALRAAVDVHGGVVVKLLGDGVMAAFGLKRVAEDDALRAVRAGAAMQEAFRALVGAEAALAVAGLRVAVNTGEVVVSGARDDVIGDPVNVAARLQEQGADGDVVLGEATRRLVSTRVTLAPLGSITLKGRAEAVPAYRLVSLEPPAGVTAAPFVGRDEELARLEAVGAAAATTPATRLAVLLGSPGLGKSRLIDEVARRHGDGATVLSAHCDAAGGATFAPLAQALRRLLGLADGAAGEPVRTAVAAALPATSDDGERTRIANGIDGLLTGAATSPEETFFVVRRFLAGLAAAKPVLLVIDDLHWAEPLLLDLVEHLVQWGGGVPIFLLVGARPELRDLRSSLVTPGGTVSDVVTLAGLDAGAAMRLAANVIGAADLPAAVAAKVLATSEGNPLFVGELVRMLVQEGALTKDGDRWIVGAGLAALEMPPTIHALLAARIERLASEDRTVLERAAVVGRHFSRSAVAALLGLNGPELDGRLESLRRSELIERDTGWLLGEPVMRFHHVLIRDAAYRRLLKGTRAELHARLADWIEAQVGETPEHDEMIGWHLEQAHQLLRELGPLDAAGARLGERAARRLTAAGRRALARDDVSLAAGLLGRALKQLGADAPERADLVLDWCEALLAAGDVGPAADAIAELDRVAGDASDGVAGDARLRAWHTCFAGQLTVLTAPEALHETADRVGAAARELAALNDAGGEAKAHFVHAQALARLGKIGACEAALDQALAAARRAGDRRRANAVLAGAPLAALWGPSPVTRASGRCLDVVRVLRITQGAPAVEAVALSCQGVLEALRGRTEAARRMLASSRTMVEELGISHRLYETDVFAGRIDLLEGNAPAAERALRAGYNGLRDLGLGIDAARAAALLGRALLAQDRAAEAETLSHESELLAGDDLQAAIAWRGVRAEALARRGDHTAAIAFAEAAVAIAAATDALLDHADARLALAAALRAVGRAAEADGEERRAIDLWEAKGATVLAERARRPADGDGEIPTPPPPATHAEQRVRRRIRPSAGYTVLARVEAAFAARDLAAMGSFADSFEEVSHPTGTAYGREQMLLSLERFLRLPGAWVRHEILATLGDTLLLVRRWMGASAAGRERFDVGEYEKEEVAVFEIEADGTHLRTEIFAADHLGDAIAHVYRRYAETLPRGAQQERAVVTARVVAFMVTRTPGVPPAFDELWAPTSITVDHRSVGYGTLTGEDSSRFLTSWRELAEDMQLHVDDVLALEPHGFVRKTTSAGVWREGGGAFERTVCMLSAFGADGRVAHHETFDANRELDALARFDALTTGAPMTQPVRRRVRANDASALAARFEAAFTAGDTDAIAALWADTLEVVDHANGATYDRDGHLASIRRLQRARDPRMRFEVLATLGASLCLARRRIASSGTGGGRFDVGESEYEVLVLFEVDERGAGRRVEIFASDHLGAAIARLYERSAEKMPEGPSREHTAVAARGVAYLLTKADVPELSLIYAASYEDVDHRTVGYGHVSGEALGKLDQSLQALADDIRFRIDDVLALEPHGFVRTTTSSGTWREGGGAFERTVCTLSIFGPDGRITNHETFDTGRAAEALARFDALTAGAPTIQPMRRPVRPNAATRCAAEYEAICAARDFVALATFFVDDAVCIDHPTGATYGGEGMRKGIERLLQSPDARVRHVPLATLGESWTLIRREISASGSLGGRFDVGPYEIVDVAIQGTNERGRLRHFEIFAAERLGAAIVGLYERYAERLPDGPGATRARAIARSLAAFDGPSDFDRIANANAPSVEIVDHRILGTWSAHGREACLTQWQGQFGLTAESGCRNDAVLALEPAAILVHSTFFGVSRESGGDFENVLLALHVFDGDGRIARTEVFEPDQETEALARFDALTAGAAPGSAPRRRVRPPRVLRANAATAAVARFDAALAAHDEAALADALAGTVAVVDHANGAEYGRDGLLRSFQQLLRMDDPTIHHEPLATLGESLALFRQRIGGRGGRLDVGAYERDEICVYEVGADGRFRHVESFAAERLRPAIVRLYERYAASLPEGPARVRPESVAHALAVYDGPIDPDRIASGHSPSFVCVDHRIFSTWSAEGREPWRRHWQEQAELAAAFTPRDDDVLALDPGAYVLRTTFGGVGRASGGTIENVLISVSVHDADGLIARVELFEPDQVAEALARFAALTVDAAPQRPVRRRVRPNAATRTFTTMEAAFARRDLAAVDALLGDPLETIEHPTATRYGREGQLESSRRMMRMPDLSFRIEPLATLGDALCLARRIVTASGTSGGKFDVGAYEIESIVVNAVDAAGRLKFAEVFASDHLCQAIARLYALYAESLSDGPERTRAAGIASSHAVWGGPLDDFDRFMSVFAPSFVCTDHRSLGTWSVEGRAEFMQHWRGQNELAAGFSRRDNDILALAPGANLTCRTMFGINRATGGSFENVLLHLDVFGADGLYTHCELFEPGQEAEALARFDELVAGEQTEPPLPRRVQANAASRSLARFEAILATRDRDALGDVFAESLSFTHHPTGATYGRRETLGKWRSIMKAERMTFRSEVLATLGERLALERHSLGIDGLSESHLAEFGQLEFDEAVVLEVDEAGRWSNVELFEADRLGTAVDRLYERYAELLPEGPARVRAAATAQAMATFGRSATDPDAFVAAFAPAVVAVDYRTVGFGELHGREVVVGAVRALLELSEDVTWRLEKILALSEHANLMRATQRGRSRESGGEWERTICTLRVHGTDGLITRWEIFEADLEAAALARYDALVDGAAPGPTTAPFANAVSRYLERYARTWATRDWPAQADLYAQHCRFDDRRPLLQMQLPREANLEQLRVLFEVPNGRWTFTPIATRGEHLMLARLFFEGDVAGGGGALEIDHLGVLEVDGSGRMTAVVLFEPADLDAAYAELDACYDAGEGAAYGRLASAGTYARAYAQRDWDAIAAMCTPTFTEHDHRAVAVLGTRHGPAAWAETERALVELAPDSNVRFNHVRSNARGAISQLTFCGADSGYEIPYLSVTELGTGGKLERNDLYDPEQIDQALARFAELTAPAPSAEPFANAASAAVAPVISAMIAHDWQRFAELFADDFRMSDRRRLVQLELDRDQYIAFTREIADGRTVRATSELLATRGERLALTRPVYEFSDADVGPSEVAFLILTEVDARGRIVAYVRWDVEDLDAAYAELDARWRAGGAAADPRVAGFQAAFDRALASRDWEALAALFAPTLDARDHRLVGWDVLRGPAAFIGALQAMVELAPDALGRADHLRTSERGLIGAVVWVGTRDGGAFESPFVWVVELDAAGLAERLDFYDPHHRDSAWARFEELRPDPLRIPPNAATRAYDRWYALADAGDWESVRVLFDDQFRFEDRRRLMRLTGDRDMGIASDRYSWESGGRPTRTVISTAGDRLVLQRMLWTVREPGSVSEVEHLELSEVNAEGRFLNGVMFDPDDRAAASTELFERYAASGADGAMPETLDTVRAWNAHDMERLRVLLPADFYLDDRRRTGVGRLDGRDAYLGSVAALWELSRDVRTETLYTIESAPHARLYVSRWFGTNTEGGEFDSVYVCVGFVEGNRGALEIFELDDLDAARARFAALRSASKPADLRAR